MKTIYVADDGTQFDDEYECESYEWLLNHKHFSNITFFDDNNKLVTNFFDEGTYWKVVKVAVDNDESVQELKDYAEYTGFTSYEDITEPGVWVWGDKDSLNQGFIKVV